MHGPQQKEVLSEAIKSVETLRDEVRSDRKRYEGIASGNYMSGKLLLAQRSKPCRTKVDGSEPQKPVKKGKSKR